MKQLRKIFAFELRNYLTNKVFVGITIAVAALIIIITSGISLFSGITEEEGPEPDIGDKAVMLVCAKDGTQAEIIRSAFSESFYGYDVQTADYDTEAVKEKIDSGDAECAFVFESITSYTYYVGNLGMYDSNPEEASEVLKTVYQSQAMKEAGIDDNKVQEILSVMIEGKVETLGKDQYGGFFYTYAMIFVLYMVILLYGQMVATNVASEKSSRAMELLITSAKPVNMMFGKVFASCAAGLIQIIVIFGTAILSYGINKKGIGDNQIVSAVFNIPPELLVYMIVFFVLGFLVYAFLYGAVGSTTSKLEDVNTAVMPLTMMFIIAFMTVMFSMTSGSIDNPIMVFCSFFPLTSPMAMFTRIAMSTVPTYQIIISIAILAGSVVGIGYIAAKIYRVGVLLYGNRPKLKDVWKMARKA